MDRRRFLLATALLSAVPMAARSFSFTHDSLDLSHHDGRITHVRVMPPQSRTGASPALAPVVLFSHGANSSGYLYDAILEPVVRAGYLVITVNHLDAGGPPPVEKIPAEGLFHSRVADLALPLLHRDQINLICLEHGIIPDWNKVCAMGHSFGAVVAMSLAGARLVHSTDAEPAALPHAMVSRVITLSSPGPRDGLVPTDAWAGVRIPSLTVTGTQDILPGFIDDWAQHILGYEAGSDGHRWQVVGQDVDHYFGGLICRLAAGAKAEAQRPALIETAAVITDFLGQWSGTNAPSPTTTEYSQLTLQLV